MRIFQLIILVFLPERYNQSILKKSKLILDENDRTMAKVNIKKLIQNFVL